MTPIPQLSPIADDPTLDAIAAAVERRGKTGSNGNGRISGEWARWCAALFFAATVAYFTTIGTMDTEIEKVKTTEDAHFQELLRRMDVMQADIRELRGRP